MRIQQIVAALTLCYTQAMAQANFQGQAGCGTPFMTAHLLDQHEGLQDEIAANENQIRVEGQQQLHDTRSLTPPTYIIPVVFHVIHNYGAENISDAQILDAVAMLNADFRKLNSDTSQIVAPFDTLAADCEIEFRLAQLDPNGNCTNGIDRIASLETNVGDDGSKLNPWPRDRYLNIWVVKQITASSVSGYTYAPAAVAASPLAPLDGILMLHSYVGRIGTGNPAVARALTHETGHWLGLLHIAGATACSDGDGIADTPPTSGWVTCQLVNTDVCTPGVAENVQNFMENSYCKRMFTRGQRDFMHIVLNSSVSARNNLWMNMNLSLTGVLNSPITCVPHADFKANRRMICAGGTVTFTDLTWSDTASAWQWLLQGPVTLTSTTQNPVFANITSAGWYDATLIVTNSSGSDTITKPNYLLVSNDTATFNSTYSESFETPNVFYLGYIANDQYGYGSTFSQTFATGNSGSASAGLNLWANNVQGDVDELITPAYDLSYNLYPRISFAYAYTVTDTVTPSQTEYLKLYSSIDCGQVWTLRWARSGTALRTTASMAGPFIPADSSQWDTVSVNLPASTAMPNVRFKFEFTSPNDNLSNNLYLDDINILSSNVGIPDTVVSSGFNLYPNPGNGQATVSYTLTEAATVNCNVYDLSGRLMYASDQGRQGAGNYSLPLCSGVLSAGTYFVVMKIGDAISTQKYVVTE